MSEKNLTIFKFIGQLKGIRTKLDVIDEKLDKIIEIKEILLLDKSVKREKTDTGDKIFKDFDGRKAYFQEGMGWIDEKSGQKLSFGPSGKTINIFENL